ncbi:MAG: DUF2378 family protein [Myxococcota bacterium]
MSGRFIERVFSSARGTPIARRLKAVGLDVEAVQPEYPAERLPSWLATYAEERYPGVPVGEAMRRAGFELVRAAPKSARSLEQVMGGLVEAFERVGNFFDVSVQAREPQRYVAHFDDVAFVPTFILGVMEGVTSSTLERAPEVTWTPAGLSGARYVVTSRS